jgi:hypothetical protein
MGQGREKKLERGYLKPEETDQQISNVFLRFSPETFDSNYPDRLKETPELVMTSTISAPFQASGLSFPPSPPLAATR